MSRIIEAVTAARPSFSWTGPIEAMAPIMRKARSCPVLYADEAFSIFLAQAEGGDKYVRYDSFGCVRPMFPALWVEGGKYAALVSHSAVNGVEQLTVATFGVNRSGDVLGPLTHHEMPMNERGECIDSGERWIADCLSESITKRGMTEYDAPCLATLFALSLCHDRELLVRKASESPAGVETRGGGSAPFMHHYTLSVKPVRRTASGGQAATLRSVIERKLHSVRGHRVVFTADRPAFGRLVGEFWVPAHRRGSAKKGIVVKDYSIC